MLLSESSRNNRDTFEQMLKKVSPAAHLNIGALWGTYFGSVTAKVGLPG